jgi:thiol-disulfide isomerase/thioredoxin
MKLNSFLVAGVALYASSIFAEPFSDLNFGAATNQAAQSGKIVLVDFYTTWCGPCRLLDKRTWTDPEVIKVLEEKTVALRIDAEKEKDLAARYQIEAYPSVVFIKPDGTEMDRLLGFRDPKKFLVDFDAVLKGRDASTKARERRTSPDPNDPLHRMMNGRILAGQGKAAEALPEYLWCFDHGDEVVPSFYWTRVTILVSDIKTLATNYPPAKAALETRRDERQSKVFAGATNQAMVVELAYLNNALDQKEKNVAVFDKLPAGSAVRESIGRFIINQLLQAKRYADILAGKDGKAAFAESVSVFNDLNDALSPENPQKDMYEKSYRMTAVASGAHYFEALAGLKRNDEGKELGQQILKFDASAETRTTLAEAADRAGNADLAQYVKP